MNKALEKKLDYAFKRWIRFRDTEEAQGIRWGKCCSCGKNCPFDELDGGHFINTRWRATRWHEENVHAQCRSCNRFDEGNAVGYTLFMVDKYGRERVEYLHALSRTYAGFTDSEGELMLKDYRQRLKEGNYGRAV